MASVFDVANWFLHHNKFLRNFLDQDTDEISNLKLQKLLYYAQGSYLALKGKPLFYDPIEAWKHGPVVKAVYKKYCDFGASGINRLEYYQLEDEEKEVLLKVYNRFGGYSAWGLRNLTHSETPWKETDQLSEISQEKIKKYFKKHYV
ncbi:MAG: SocA family protein [Clostridiaceae bacterium]|nr:SocA family protein [Clostridiaceae bacterium]